MTGPDREIFPRNTSRLGLQSASAKGSLAILLSQVLKLGLQFGTQLILARLLFPSDFGLIAMIAPVIGFVMIINDIGFGQVIVQKEKIYQQQISNLFWINLTLGAAFCLGLIILAPLAASMYGEPKIANLLMAMALIIPLGTIGIVPTAFLSRNLQFVKQAKIEISAAVVGSAITIYGSWMGLGYWALALGQIFATVITVCCTWYICKWTPSRPVRSVSVRDEFLFGRNVTATNIANFTIKSTDALLIGAVKGPVELGFYDRSYRLLMQPLNQLLLPVTRVAVPVLSNLLNDGLAFRETYIFMVRLLVAATVPGLVVCAVDGQTLIGFLMGPRWLEAAPIFEWFCIGGLASAIFASTTWLFISQNKTGQLLRYSMTAALINVVACFVGISWGARGVAMVSSLSFLLLQTPIMLYGALSISPVGGKELAMALYPSALATILSFLILHMVSGMMQQSAAVRLFIEFFLSYSLLVGCLAATSGGRNFLGRSFRLAQKALHK